MPLNLIDALPSMGGFNRLEKEEYYRLFLSGSEDTVQLLTIAAELATAKGWSQEEAIDKLQSMQGGDSATMLALGPEFLSKMLEFDAAKKRTQQMSGFTLARLVCLSRLSLQWVQSNAADLAQYGIDITPDMLANAALVRKIDRLNPSKNADLALVVDEVLNLLPDSMVRAVENFAIDELNEGRKSAPADVEDRQETPLAAPAASSQKPATPTPPSVSSGIAATSASKPALSKTLAITTTASA